MSEIIYTRGITHNIFDMAAEAKQYVNVAEMFAGVKSGFKELLLSHRTELITALEQIDPNKISPRGKNIFNFGRFADIKEIRVCILGQDPYPDVNHAHGLAFSSLDRKLPASLKTIFDCLRAQGFLSAGGPTPSGDLSSWAAAGVLLINTALTTEIGVSNVHKYIWQPYMQKVLASIGNLDQPIVYFLWGGQAQEYAPLFKNNGKSLILNEVHPSPMAQARLTPDKKFINCNHFAAANKFLSDHGIAAINWSLSAAPAPLPAAPAPTANMNIVYTDGSASKNGGGPLSRAGYAAYFTSGPATGTKLMGRIGPVQIEDEFIFPSNIRAEGFAIMKSIEHVLTMSGPPRIEVVTDSKFWIEMITMYMPRWVNEGTPWSAKKNPDMTARLWISLCDIQNRSGELKLRHVYSHGKDKNISADDKKWNDCVDLWAGEACKSETFFDSVTKE